MGDSLMDDLAAAWEAADEEEVVEETPELEVVETTEEPVAESAPEVSTDEPADDSPAQAADSEASADTPEVDSAAPIEAPKGLSPAAREAWNDTPQAVKDDIAKREADFERGIQKYAEAAKRAQGMDQALAPFQQLMATNGGPGNVLPGLLQTASQLQFGTAQQKASAAMNIIKQFGVDIQTLDHMLAGQQPPENSQASIQEAVQAAMAPYQQMFQQQQSNTASQTAADLQAFATDPKNEFWNDVKGDVAEILDINARQGRNLSLDDAYQRACMMRDDIRQILDARAQQQQVQERRPAAVSVTGAPTGVEAPPEPSSVADYLSQAWDSVDKANRR